MLLDSLLVGTIILLLVLREWEDRRHAAERDRLTRMAFAEDKPERIAALLPARRSAHPEPKDPRPSKPIGV